MRSGIVRQLAAIAAVGLAILGPAGSVARAQAPQVDVEGPPGAPESSGGLGPRLGASGATGDDQGQGPVEGPIGGRPGPSTTRVPIGSLNPSAPRPTLTPSTSFRPPTIEPAEVPHYGGMELPPGPEDVGPPNGLTLDGAINLLLDRNLSLLALRYEIPMAQADILTASLRANPIFYADSQLIPYGHYSNHRPGGQTQYDVNVTLPLDVWRKRRARTHVAERAQRVTEAQFQDAVRLQVDNLYTVYVDVVAADETLRFSRTYAEGITRMLRVTRAKLRQGEATPDQVDALRSQVELAELQVREASNALTKATRALALMLTMSAEEAANLRVRAALQDFRPLPGGREELVRLALDNRPDLLAYRMGLQRAQADLNLANANRYSDVYLLLQPYTLQDNRPLGLKSAYSYAVGATVSLPVFNRNQGNIRRSALNVDQSRIELTAQERQVVYDVEEGIREFNVSLNAALEIQHEVLPAAKRVRDTAYRRWQGGETSVVEYLEAQKDYNDTVRRYRDALVVHRRDMLDLNTDTGVRAMP